jgi:integrase
MNGKTRLAKRTKAMCLLLAKFGLRSSEVINLLLSDIDFKQRVLTIRRAKNRRVQRLPMSHELEESLRDYITVRPPCSCPCVFVTQTAPFRKVGNSSMYLPISKKMNELEIDSRTKGPHALRHAFAERLRSKGADLDNSAIKVLGTSGRADRHVPIGADIKRLVDRQMGISRGSPFLFCAKSGKQLGNRAASDTFRRLCVIAGVHRQKDSVYQPRLCDLRHTFAVHRIIFWYRRKVSIQKKLPLLAAYMGMITVTAMEKYLLLTPAKYAMQLRQIG